MASKNTLERFTSGRAGSRRRHKSTGYGDRLSLLDRLVFKQLIVDVHEAALFAKRSFQLP
jgi:hypothetical protein